MPPVKLVPPIKHAANSGIPWISRNPDFTVVMLLLQMRPIEIETFTFAFFIGMLVHSVLIVS
jgi:hypothetical protein